MSCIRVFEKDSPEYKNLEKLGAKLHEMSAHGTEYKVENVYFDLGQDWVWTTLVAYKPYTNQRTGKLEYSSWQALYPRGHEECVLFGDDDEVIEKVAREVYESPYNPDTYEERHGH